MYSVLLQCPQILQRELNAFRKCFSKPQFANLCRLTTAMAVSQYSSISRWSGVVAPVHQSTLNDFLTQSPWNDAVVHDTLSRLTLDRIKDAWILVIDDTFSHKPYAKRMDHLGWFHDGLSKEERFGHNIVTCGVHADSAGFVPFDLELYRKGTTKNEIARRMIDRAATFGRFDFCTFDSWYTDVKNLQAVRRVGMHYVTELKSNRNVTIGNHKRWVREHEGFIAPQEWTTSTINSDTYRYLQTSAHLKGAGTINLVFSQKYFDDDKEWSETYFLITDVLCLPAETVISIFLRRNGIEGFHREAKQQLGLEDYQLRKDRGIARYLLLVMLVYVLLRLLQQPAEPHKTIGELREDVKAAYLTTQLHTTRRRSLEFIEEKARILAHVL
jgi:hypothetical protein